MKTKEIYYEQDYKKSWSTKIIKMTPLEKGFAIELEETAFYPGGGGQPCDLGSIQNQQVIEVYKVEGKTLHIVEEKPKEIEVVCCIDQQRRLDLTQQHSGQHLLSATFFNLLGGQTSSFHLGLDYVSVDISIANMSEDTLKTVEDKANQMIYDNIRIKHYLVGKEKLKNLPLRKQPTVEEDIRIVEIEGVDYSPCGGTHLESTGQLGILKIIKAENYKGNTRVYFKCGQRALVDYQNKDDILSQLISLLSSNEEEVMERVEKELDRTKNLSKEMNHWMERTAHWEARHIVDHHEGKVIVKAFEDKDFSEMERISKEIMNLGECILLFASYIDTKILLVHSGQSEFHCGKYFREHLSQQGGRGGGNDKKAQAAFSTRGELEAFYTLAKQRIEETFKTE